MLIRLRNSSTSVEIDDPENPELDNLDLGASEDGSSLATMFASRWWALIDGTVLYRFAAASGETIGFAVIEETDLPHPSHESGEVALYLYVRNLCVLANFQGQPEPTSGNSFAAEVMRAIDELILAETEAVGTTLVVREGNCRARSLYRRVGFDYDADGRRRDDDEWWLVMRKPRV